MNNYLTKKLGEESSEVAQAAFKVLLHQDSAARQDFLGEMADLQCMLDIAHAQRSDSEKLEFVKLINQRRKREDTKGKAWPKKRK